MRFCQSPPLFTNLVVGSSSPKERKGGGCTQWSDFRFIILEEHPLVILIDQYSNIFCHHLFLHLLIFFYYYFPFSTQKFLFFNVGFYIFLGFWKCHIISEFLKSTLKQRDWRVSFNQWFSQNIVFDFRFNRDLLYLVPFKQLSYMLFIFVFFFFL